jgi:hypothetical protein
VIDETKDMAKTRSRERQTKADRTAIRKAVAELRALGMDRERALVQARVEVRKLRPDLLVVDEDGNVRPRQSTKSILDW